MMTAIPRFVVRPDSSHGFHSDVRAMCPEGRMGGPRVTGPISRRVNKPTNRRAHPNGARRRARRIACPSPTWQVVGILASVGGTCRAADRFGAELAAAPASLQRNLLQCRQVSHGLDNRGTIAYSKPIAAKCAYDKSAGRPGRRDRRSLQGSRRMNPRRFPPLRVFSHLRHSCKTCR